MKRFSLIFFAILLPLWAFPRNIRSDEALSYAAKALGTSVSNLSVVWTGTEPGSEPALYAINSSKGGFAVISGTDCINPVIGYSYEGEFKSEGMPSNIRAFFGGIEKDLRRVESENLSIGDDRRGLWNIAETGTKASYPSQYSLSTATWDQDTPYNNDCVFNGAACLVGCVATAMAIIYRYHMYPDKGIGKTAAYKTSTYGYSVASIDLSKESFNWSMMPVSNEAVLRGTADQIKAVARLMRVCSSMIHMDYTASGSGAFTFAVPKASVENMGYDPSSINFLSKASCSASQWIDLLKTDISSGRPVLYAALSGGSGHAFVIDGYDSKGYFHLNWGWGGSDNGNFTLELNVGKYRFCSDQEAVFGIKPATSSSTGKIRDNLCLESSGFEITKGKFVKGEPFDFTISWISNHGSYDYDDYVRVALVDKAGTVKEVGDSLRCKVSPPSISTGSYSPITLKMTDFVVESDLSFSDMLVLQYKDSSTGKYVNMPYSREEGTRGYLIPMEYNFIDAATSYKVGDIFDFALISGKNYKSVEWYFNGDKTTDSFVCLTKAGTYTVKAVLSTEDGKETIAQEIVVK